MKFSFQQSAYALILISTILRIFLGSQIELGNDEVYYWLYAKYPDISHFDHPPMVGFFIQFFTLDLFFSHEIFIRLAAILPGSLSMLLVYYIAKELKDSKTGYIAVILYNLSFYGLIISGTFILPDAPLVLFWLLSILFFLKTLPRSPSDAKLSHLLLGFLFCGLAIYSKYQAVYLLFGAGLYVLFYNNKWLRIPWFYLFFILPLFFIGLIFFWNYQNEFISYTFHNDRVSFFSLNFNKDSFLREIMGQILYNNPYVFFLIISMATAILRKKLSFDKKMITFFSVFSLPLILTTLYLSISRNTLPHWTGISYLSLLPLTAVYVAEKGQSIVKLRYGLLSIAVLLIVAVFSIRFGWFLPESSSKTPETLGEKDVFMDLYGWRQASAKVKSSIEENKLQNLQIISNKWYPAAHIDYYLATPLGMTLYCIGDLKEIHKYYWVNQTQKPLEDEVLFITDSRNYKSPEIFGKTYPFSELIETIPITRDGSVVKNVFLFRLKKTN